jgi:hypothetical protein
VYEVATRFKFGDKSLAKRGDDGLPISRASQLENTMADLVRPLNSDRSLNSVRSFLSVWLPKPDGVFD